MYENSPLNDNTVQHVQLSPIAVIILIDHCPRYMFYISFKQNIITPVL